MKIIDERGRLFRKINVIDFLVILFLLFLMPVFYFGYKILTKRPMVEVTERGFIEIEINCRLIKLKPELLKMISVGEKELDENGEVIGEILSLGQSEPYKYEFDIGRQKIIKEDALLKQVEAKLKLRAEDIESKPFYKDKTIEIGSPIEFTTDNFTLIAIPFEEGKEERIINLYVTLIDLDQELLKEISVGDKETDENDNTIAEILSLGQVEDSSLEFDLGSGSIVKEEEGAKKQISTRMRLKCQVENGSQLFFKGKKLDYNSRIEFKTDKYEISGIAILDEEGKEERIINLYVTLIDLDQELLKEISVGDKETDENDNTIAEILSLGQVEDSSLEFDLGSGSIVKEEEGAKKQISVRMRLKCQVDGSELYFKGEKVEHNSLIELKTDKYEITGLVTLNEKWLKLRVKFSMVIPEVARFIQKGDIENDVFERTIGRIESILSNEPALMMEAVTDEGKFITLHHPLQRDIVVSLDAQCIEKDGAYYYKESLAKIGIDIVFSTTSYSILGTIVGLRIE